MKVLQSIRKDFIKKPAAEGHPHFGVPARHHRDREPRDHAARRRR